VRIIIQNTSKVPIYEQIKEQIKEGILSGELKEDDTLPSIRQLASELKISVITTRRAYTLLEEEGLIAIQQGKGCVVLPKNREIVREHLFRKIEDNFTQAVNVGKIARLTREELIAMLELILEELQFEQHG
jgi:GntR family transcriptional regulator